MKWTIKVFLIALVYPMLFGGCAAVPRIPVVEKNLEKGLVIGTVNYSDAYGIALKSSKGEDIFLSVYGSLLNDKCIFSWLKPDTYTISSVAGHDVPEDAFPSFEVVAGGVVDLNYLIPYSFSDGRSSVIAVERREPFSSPVVPSLPDWFEGVKASSWKVDKPVFETRLRSDSAGVALIVDAMVQSDTDKRLSGSVSPSLAGLIHDDALELIKSLSRPTTRAEISADGTAYFGAALGQVRYKRNGAWANLDTGLLDSITALEVISSKDIVVALESGKVLRSGDGGGTWEEIYYFKDAQVPFEILWAENKLIIATSKQVDGHESHNQNSHPRIQVHELVGDTLETLFDQTFPTIFYFTNLYSEARVEYISGSLFVFAPTKSAYRLDDNSGEWKVIDLPDFYGMSVSNDHQLIAIWTAKGAFSSVHYSSDLGESWIKLPSPPLLTTHVEMYSKTEGFLWSVKPGWYTSSYKHLRLNSAKNRWSSVGKAPVSCEAILMNPLAKEFYCVFPGGEIHTISDSTGYQ